MPKPSDLLQGTLDLLILKTVSRKPLHGWGISEVPDTKHSRATLCLWAKAPSIPRSTGSKIKAGFARTGKSRISDGPQKSIP